MTQPTQSTDTGLVAALSRRIGVLREVVLVTVVGLISLGITALAADNQPETHQLGLGGVLLLGLTIVALPLRYRSPMGALTLAWSATLAYITLDYAMGPIWFPLIITLGYAVMRGHRRFAVAILVVGFFAFPWIGFSLGRDDPPDLVAIAALAAWLITLFSVSELVRSRRDRAEAARRSREEAERLWVTEERLQIARELHDVVAHNMSLISIQAGVGLHLMDTHPERARDSLATIKQASKEALVELRSVLGVLRQVDETDGPSDSDVDGAPRSPTPSLRHLDDLVERSRAAGVSVNLSVERELLDGLPRAVDLAAFRIVQESLTNVARHSFDRAAAVRIDERDGGLAIEVLDEGIARARPEVPGSGHGIAGMRERAVALGGWLEAGPRPGQGFAVRAWLPLRPDEAPAPPSDANEVEREDVAG